MKTVVTTDALYVFQRRFLPNAVEPIFFSFFFCCSFFQIWSENWGELYAVGEPTTYKGKIEKLQAKMKQCPGRSQMTTYQMSYGEKKPYSERGNNYRRRTFGKFEDEITTQYLPNSQKGRQNCIGRDDSRFECHNASDTLGRENKAPLLILFVVRAIF